LEYLQGDLDAAAKSLSTNDHITSDKSGWNLGYKLLQMMIHIDENDLFLVDYQIKNFNRLLSPKKTETENIARARVISKVIRLFIKHRGDFKETFEVAKDVLMNGSNKKETKRKIDDNENLVQGNSEYKFQNTNSKYQLIM